MASLRMEERIVETAGESPIVSHQSHVPAVYAVCHHSGRYLTRNETNPRRIPFLSEQHDFPGLPRLDHSFNIAAHSLEHQHPVWSRVGIKALGLAISGLVILLLAALVWGFQPFVAGGLLLLLFTGMQILLALAGLGLLLWAAYLLARREAVFHANATGLPPVIPDYPLECTYEVNAREEIIAALGNTRDATAEEPVQPTCSIAVIAHPVANELEDYAAYRTRYDRHPVGEYVHAGVLALAGIQGVAFGGENIEYGHRLVLRVPRESVDTIDSGGFAPFTVDAPYKINRAALYPKEAGLERFLVECWPRLVPGDSRTLRLCFDWHALGLTPTLRLHSCTLQVPTELGKVTRVRAGRYAPDEGCVIWQNAPFTGRALELWVTFEHPVLSYQEALKGTYQIYLEELVSGLEISPEHLWTAWGQQAKSGTSLIRRETIVRGDLQLDLRRLSQEHEYVRTIIVPCDVAPDHRLMQAVTAMLVKEEVDLLRVAEATPRLNPAGGLDTRLHYWDIAGRHYHADRLDPYDIHVVITGHDQVPLARAGQPPEPHAEIELTVRCLHDPRNLVTPNAADDLITKTDSAGNDLAARLSQAVAELQPQ